MGTRRDEMSRMTMNTAEGELPQVEGIIAGTVVEPVSGFEPLTFRLQGAFE